MIDRFARHISFFAPAAVMGAWGTVMVHAYATGHLNRLLSPMFRSNVLIGGIVLMLLSAGYVLLYQPSTNPAPALAPTGRLRQLLRWTVMLLPVLAAAVLSPDALSSTTGDHRFDPKSTYGVAAMPQMDQKTAQDVKDAMAADPSQPVPVDVTDLITLSRTPAQMKSFDGRKVHAVGFVVPGEGGLKLLRWMMWCCAADAMPVSVKLTGNVAGPFKEDQWYEIVGTAQFPSTLGQVIPSIEVDTVKPTVEPDEPYLSP